MARKEVSAEVREYIFSTSDNANTYPTSAECGAGSTITLIDEATHEVTAILMFDGTNWNEM